ncbi:MAG: cobalt transporter CbiM [Sulfurospirillum sp.]|nr:cobalt transporter CbiM [Sulfurospirillum sp.]
MHISEGVLSANILIASDVIALGILAYAFWRLQREQMVFAAVLSALFFVASFVHIPIGPTATHLLMSGIVGLFLGVGAFVAIFVGLLLQALLFGYGGVSVLGVNLLIIATPALIARFLFQLKLQTIGTQLLVDFLMGALPILVSSLLLAGVLALDNEAFLSVAILSLLTNLPIVLLEGIFMVMILRYLRKVSPRLLEI